MSAQNEIAEMLDGFWSGKMNIAVKTSLESINPQDIDEYLLDAGQFTAFEKWQMKYKLHIGCFVRHCQVLFWFSEMK